MTMTGMWLVCVRRLQPAQHLEAAHFRHDEIEQDQIEVSVAHKLQRRGAGRCGHDLMPVAHQPALEHVAIGRIVVDN